MILFRTSGAWGPGSGANLTAAQVDGNFYDVHTRVQFLELHPPTPVQITSFSVSGDKLYIYMSDGTVQGPLTLPTSRWFFRGAWHPNTNYAVDDLITGPDSAVYLVTFSHTSGAVFNPGANDGQGHNFYGLLLAAPSTSLPTGGGAGFVLTKASDVDYNFAWNPPPAPFGGVRGQVLQKNTSVDGDAGWWYLSFNDLVDVALGSLLNGDYLQWDANINGWINKPPFTVLRSSSWSPVIGNEGSFMVLTNGGANATIIIPSDSTQSFRLGTELHIHQDGTGLVTVVGESGVTILKHASFSNVLLGQYATATAKKTGVNEWRLFGLLAGA